MLLDILVLSCISSQDGVSHAKMIVVPYLWFELSPMNKFEQQSLVFLITLVSFDMDI